MAAPHFQVQPVGAPEGLVPTDEDDTVPVTSRPCQWKQPRKMKESSMRMGEAQFQKHVYGREKKRRLRQMEDFDPRPIEFRGTARDRLPQPLEKLRGEQLCISLLFDEHFRHWDSSKTPEAPTLPDIPCLKESCCFCSRYPQD